MKMETLKQQILTAKGDVRAELVLKNARVINVFTNEIEQADVAIFPNGFIYGIGGAGLCATIWAVIIPAVLAIKARKKFPNQMFTVWGGNLIPAIVILFGITVILCWFGNVFNVLPKFG